MSAEDVMIRFSKLDVTKFDTRDLIEYLKNIDSIIQFQKKMIEKYEQNPSGIKFFTIKL